MSYDECTGRRKDDVGLVAVVMDIKAGCRRRIQNGIIGELFNSHDVRVTVSRGLLLSGQQLCRVQSCEIVI